MYDATRTISKVNHNKILSSITGYPEKMFLDISYYENNKKSFEYIFLASFIELMKDKFNAEYDFQVRIINIDEVNGLATKYGKTYYSCIYRGTISKCYESAKVLANNNILFSNSDLYENYNQDIAWLICYFSVFSTIFHEMGHILDGHIDYNIQTFGDNILYLSDTRTDLFATDIRKTLEIDADEFSGNRISDIGFNNLPELKKLYPKVIDSKDVLVKFMILGVANKFLHYGIYKYESNPLYPPNAYRIVLIVDALYHHSYATNYITMPYKQFSDIFNECINIILDNSLVNCFSEQLTRGLDESNTLKKMWNSIYNDLNEVKNSKVTLAPIYED